MSLKPLKIAPGVFGDVSQYHAKGRYFDGDRVRFRDGLPENIGGYRDQALNLIGVPRRSHAWVLNDGVKVAALGTHTKLYLIYGGARYDITPIRDSGTLGNDPFGTTIGLSTVDVTHTSHGLTAGDSVNPFAGATAVGGLTINGEYLVQSVTAADTYVIDAGSAASSTATGGGAAVTYKYEINIGSASADAAYGWGAGPWNEPRDAGNGWNLPAASSDITVDLRIWSLSNWGEDLLAMPRGGQIYHWDASSGPTKVATVVSASPTGEWMTVDAESRHVLVFGADGDPFDVKNCNQGNFTDWTVAATKTTDSRRLLAGGGAMTSVISSREILVLTDGTLHSMRYVGAADYAFSLDPLGSKCGVIGPNAVVEHNGVAYWMGRDQFFRYDGRVQVLPCTLLRSVFNNLDLYHRDKVVAGVNRQFNEIWFFYPTTAGSGEPDAYVIYNYSENVWAPGTLGRTAWMDRDVFICPWATDENGVLYEHEFGEDADGAAHSTYIESGYFDIYDGEFVALVRGLIPDFTNKEGGDLDGTVDVTFKARNYPGDTVRSKGPYAVTSATRYRKGRARGRRIAIRFSSNTVGTAWRAGTQQVDVKQDGKR